MQIFFLNGLWRLLKNGHLPAKLYSSAPRGEGNAQSWKIVAKWSFLTVFSKIWLKTPSHKSVGMET